MRQITTLAAIASLAVVAMTARAVAVDVGGRLTGPPGIVEQVQREGGSRGGGVGGGSPGASPGRSGPGAVSPGPSRGGSSYGAPPGSSGPRAARGRGGGDSVGIRSGSRAMRGNDARSDRHRKGRRHHRRSRGYGVYIGPRYGYYDYSDCAWLRRRAIRTGSPYWWWRYRQCVS